jgi:hypothetical protein
MGTLFVGTSGFAYPAWKPGFYPARLPLATGLDLYLMFKHEETPAGALNAELVWKKAGDSDCRY